MAFLFLTVLLDSVGFGIVIPIVPALLQDVGDVPLALPEGVRQVAPCDDCDAVWDVWRDTTVEVDALDPEAELLLHADDSGLARLYARVDRFELDEDGHYLPAVITVTTPGAEELVLLVPR
jgi:hypothetical protein